MNNLKTKWDEQTTAIKIAVVAVGAVVALIFVVKILPALIAAMGIGIFLAILFVPYWLPTIIAFFRHHPSKFAILAVNFFFGWTFIGWVIALAWALSDNTGRAPTSIIVNTTTSVNPNITVGTSEATQARPPQYQVGDVVNGHRFDGVSWQSVESAPRPSVTPRSGANGMWGEN